VTTSTVRRLTNRYVAPRPGRLVSCEEHDGLPDPACTPGATDPRVTETTIDSTICVSGYTKRVRPPTRVTTPIKREQMRAYDLTGQLSA